MSPEEIAKNIRNALENLVQCLQAADDAGLVVSYDIRKGDDGKRGVVDFRVQQTINVVS